MVFQNSLLFFFSKAKFVFLKRVPKAGGIRGDNKSENGVF